MEKYTPPGTFWLSPSEVANNLRYISWLLDTTINASDHRDPVVEIILKDFKEKFIEKIAWLN